MIANIDEVVALGARLAATISESLRIRTPGCSETELNRIRQLFPEMPGAYLDLAGKIDLRDVELGGFSLAPRCVPGDGLCRRLMMANGADAGMTPWLKKQMSYEVAVMEVCSVAIVHSKGDFEPGSVIIFDDSNLNSPAQILVGEFLHFVLLAANLEEIWLEMPDDPIGEGHWQELERRMPLIVPTIGADEVKTWNRLLCG